VLQGIGYDVIEMRGTRTLWRSISSYLLYQYHSTTTITGCWFKWPIFSFELGVKPLHH